MGVSYKIKLAKVYNHDEQRAKQYIQNMTGSLIIPRQLLVLTMPISTQLDI